VARPKRGFPYWGAEDKGLGGSIKQEDGGSKGDRDGLASCWAVGITGSRSPSGFVKSLVLGLRMRGIAGWLRGPRRGLTVGLTAGLRFGLPPAEENGLEATPGPNGFPTGET
jgi:hypothetical protein